MNLRLQIPLITFGLLVVYENTKRLPRLLSETFQVLYNLIQYVIKKNATFYHRIFGQHDHDLP